MLPGMADVPVPAEDGRFISQTHARISELIKEYDSTLELAWIPPERLEPGDKPFAVIARPTGRPAYIVCYADECDERLLARIYSMDSKDKNVLSEIDKHNEALRQIERKRAEDEAAEMREFAASVLRSPKSTYRHGGRKYT